MSGKSLVSMIRSAIANFTPVAGKTVLRVLTDVGAVGSGLSPKDVRKTEYNGREAFCYDIKTATSIERYHYVKESARFSVIKETYPFKHNEKKSCTRILDEQLPQIVGPGPGEASSSSSKK